MLRHGAELVVSVVILPVVACARRKHKSWWGKQSLHRLTLQLASRRTCVELILGLAV
jgi:hypothetical protein